MKKALFLAFICLSACSQAPSLTPEQEAVAAYVKQNANDPASYAPVRWGKAVGYTRRDSARADAAEAAEDAAKYGGGYQKRFDADMAITDTTRVGISLSHTYRVKNQFGATVLDSAEFAVYRNGKVVRL